MTIAAVVDEALHETVGLSTDECLKCNICNEVCPVARVDDRFPGPKYVGPQAQRFRLAAPVPINRVSMSRSSTRMASVTRSATDEPTLARMARTMRATSAKRRRACSE